MKTKNVPCDREFQAEWIWDLDSKENHKPNTWMAFRKKVIVDKKPSIPVISWIAAESKYWLYINGEMVTQSITGTRICKSLYGKVCIRSTVCYGI